MDVHPIRSDWEQRRSETTVWFSCDRALQHVCVLFCDADLGIRYHRPTGILHRTCNRPCCSALRETCRRQRQSNDTNNDEPDRRTRHKLSPIAQLDIELFLSKIRFQRTSTNIGSAWLGKDTRGPHPRAIFFMERSLFCHSPMETALPCQ